MSRSLYVIPVAIAVLSGCATTKMGNVIPEENDYRTTMQFRCE